MTNNVEKDRQFRDELVDKAKAIYDLVRTRQDILSVNFLSDKMTSMNKEIETLIDESVEMIGQANVDKFLFEKKVDRDSKICNEALVDKEKKIFSQIDFHEVSKGDIKAYVIEDLCKICSKKRTLTCVKEHFTFSCPLRMSHGFGPISSDDVYECDFDEEAKRFRIKNMLNLYEIDDSENAKDLISKHRGGVIVQKELSYENLKLDLNSVNLCNTIGVINKEIVRTINKQEIPTTVASALNKGKLVEKIFSDAIHKSVFLLDSNNIKRRITIKKPNVRSIIKHSIKLDGRNFNVINKAFIIVRRVKVKAGDNVSEFVEPIYVCIENELNKIVEPPKKPENTCLMTRVFYLSRDEENKKDVIRGILIKAEELYEKTLDIASEMSAMDENLKKSGTILDVLDRNVALKVIVNPKDYSKMNLKEYHLTTNNLQNILTVNIIKETDETPIRFKTKEMAEMKHPTRYLKVMKYALQTVENIKTKLDLERENYSEDILMPNIEGLSGEIIARICMRIEADEKLYQVLYHDQEEEENTEPKMEEPNPDIMTQDDFSIIHLKKYITKNKILIEKYDEEKKDFVLEQESNLLSKEMVIKKLKTDPFKSVSDLKFDVKKNEYKETRGVYSLINTEGREKYRIKASHKMKISEAITDTVQGVHTKKDILTSQLVNEKGDLVVEIEQKTDFYPDKKPDKKEIPLSQFKFDHSKRLLCDSLRFEEYKTHVILSRLLITSPTTAVKVTITEPNTKFIASYRSILHQGNKDKLFLNYYCSKEEVLSCFDADGAVIEFTPENDAHKKNCEMNLIGRFGIVAQVKITEMRITNKLEEEEVEVREEPKLIHMVCEKCPESQIMMDNGDTLTDACNFTMLREKLSIYDFLSALDHLIVNAKSNFNIERDESSMKRFKHRLQRAIFNVVQ